MPTICIYYMLIEENKTKLMIYYLLPVVFTQCVVLIKYHIEYQLILNANIVIVDKGCITFKICGYFLYTDLISNNYLYPTHIRSVLLRSLDTTKYFYSLGISTQTNKILKILLLCTALKMTFQMLIARDLFLK